MGTVDIDIYKMYTDFIVCLLIFKFRLFICFFLHKTLKFFATASSFLVKTRTKFENHSFSSFFENIDVFYSVIIFYPARYFSTWISKDTVRSPDSAEDRRICAECLLPKFKLFLLVVIC